MGNAVISGILFQPPHPPNALDIADPVPTRSNDPNNSSAGRSATTTTSLTNKHANIDVRYIWVYSKANNDSSNISSNSVAENDEWDLIPAIHIKHKDPPPVVKDFSSNIAASSSLHQNNNVNNNSTTTTTTRYTLLYSHGNAEDIGLISTFLVDLARLLQIDVLCYDYSGYGLSTDIKYVNEFYKLYGNEIVAWKHWCFYGGNEEDRWDECLPDDDNGDGRCKYSKSVFVAPIVHPREDSRDDKRRSGVLYSMSHLHNEEEEESSVYDFTNTCGNWTTATTTAQDEAAVATTRMKYDRGTSNSSSSSQRRFTMNLHHDNIRNYHTQNSYNSNKSSSYNNHRSNSQYVYSQQQPAQHTWASPTTSEVKCYANILSVYNYLTTIEDISSKHVILYGKSVGSGPTCWLAQRICSRGSQSLLHRHNIDMKSKNAGGSVESNGSSGSLCMEHVGLNSYDNDDNEDDDNGTCSGMSLHDEMCFVGDECREPVQQETRSPLVVSSKKKKKKRVVDRGGGEGVVATEEGSSAIGGVVLHSPFLSVIRVVLDVGFTTLGDLFPNVDRVGDFT